MTSRRVGRLRPVALPGGEAAIREPWRSAVAHLADAGVEATVPGIERARIEALQKILVSRVVSPLASSAGRLFDAVAAIAGVKADHGYEGEAAIHLEARATGTPDPVYPLPREERNGLLELDTRPLVRAIACDESSVETIAARFHASLASGVASAATELARREGLATVALVGGCFQNERLLDLTATALRARGLEVLFARQLPAGDGGLSLGQAAVASARLARGQ